MYSALRNNKMEPSMKDKFFLKNALFQYCKGIFVMHESKVKYIYLLNKEFTLNLSPNLNSSI